MASMSPVHRAVFCERLHLSIWQIHCRKKMTRYQKKTMASILGPGVIISMANSGWEISLQANIGQITVIVRANMAVVRTLEAVRLSLVRRMDHLLRYRVQKKCFAIVHYLRSQQIPISYRWTPISLKWVKG